MWNRKKLRLEVPLTADRWVATSATGQKGGWRVPELGIPGVELRALRRDGVSTADLLFEQSGITIRWRGAPSPPPGIVATLGFRSRPYSARAAFLLLLLGGLAGFWMRPQLSSAPIIELAAKLWVHCPEPVRSLILGS